MTDDSERIDALSHELTDLRQRVDELEAQRIALEQQLVAQQRTEQLLRRREERFRLLAEHARDIVFRYRFIPPRGFEYVSPSVETILGYTPDEYYADPDIDLKCLHPESRPIFAVSQQSPGVYREPIIMRHLRKDGTDVWIEQNYVPILDANGRMIAIEGISRDITDRMRMEAQLRQAYQNMKVMNDRLQVDLSTAQRIQASLLPPPKPNWNAIDVLCSNMPAQDVGGDFYVYHHFDSRLSRGSQRFALAVGDVSGKGMPAALLMAISLASFQSLITQSSSLNKLLTERIAEVSSLSIFLSKLDRAIAPYTATIRQNCALVYVEITCFADAQRPTMLQAVNAGGIMPIVRRSDGTVEWVDAFGLPLGLGTNIGLEYQEKTATLSPGDMVILVSDGIVEAQNSDGEWLGFDRLESIIADGPDHSAEALHRHIHAAVSLFAGQTDQHDDMTMIVIHLEDLRLSGTSRTSNITTSS